MLCITFRSFHHQNLCSFFSPWHHYRALAWQLLRFRSKLLDFSIWEVFWDLVAEWLLFTSALKRTSENMPTMLAWEIYLDIWCYYTKSLGSHKAQSDSSCFINDLQLPQRSLLLVFTSRRAEDVYIRVKCSRRVMQKMRHLSSSPRWTPVASPIFLLHEPHGNMDVPWHPSHSGLES